MLATNTTPFAAIGFEQLHRDGEPMATLAVRGTFNLHPDLTLSLAENQDLLLSDEYDGRPDETPLARVGDLIPFKPAADVTVLADALAPEGKPHREWVAGLRVGGGTAHLLRILGPRFWEPVNGDPGWRLTQPEPTDRVAIDYRLAAGGLLVGDRAREVDARNPIGTGVLSREYTPRDTLVPAPQIEAEATPVGDPFEPEQPAGFGPVAPAWVWRQGFAGTYDEAWTRDRHPLLPTDFDYRFYQTAHPSLIQPGYLRGDELVELGRLLPGVAEEVSFHLPGVVPQAVFEWESGTTVATRLNLDGLHLDLRGPGPWRVDLTWRGWVVRGEGFFKIDLHALGLGDPALVHLAATGEHGVIGGGP
jgi:hypothetical protein